jgi:hypothetical protein
LAIAGTGTRLIDLPSDHGAAEHRCNGYPPYEKTGLTERDHWFRMPKDVAEIIKELAAEWSPGHEWAR